MPFCGLTPGAQKTLTIWTQAIARAHGAASLQPSHLLQAILDHYPQESAAACALIGQTRDDLVSHAGALLHSEKCPRLVGDVPPSRDAKRVVEESAQLAQQHQHEYIGVGHLFGACLAYLSDRRGLEWFSTMGTAGRSRGLAAQLIAAFNDLPPDAAATGATAVTDRQARPPPGGSSVLAAAVLRTLEGVEKPIARLDPK